MRDGVHLDADRHAAVHGDRQRLCAAHAAEPAGEGHGAGQRPAEALGGYRGERLVGALQDALAADVDPGAGGHLAVHGQPERLEPAELLPVGPVADQVGVGEQHPRRPLVGGQDADRLAGLHQQRLVGLQGPQGPDDRVVRRPVAGGLAGAAVDHEPVGMLGDIGIEVVLEHAQRGLLRPPEGREPGASGGPDLPLPENLGARTRRTGGSSHPATIVRWWVTRFGAECRDNAVILSQSFSEAT